MLLPPAISLPLCLLAQTPLIQWSNPSFEDVPGPGRPPLGWYFCGPMNETPPDVHPVFVLNVTQDAKHGKTYAGLVVRDNGTQETLGQMLAQPLRTGACYEVRLYACRAAGFSSYSRLTGMQANFSEPVKLQLWGGTQHCGREHLLAETTAITDTTWQLYELAFTAPADCDQLFFSAAYTNDSLVYNGHLLLDHLSPLIPIDCRSRMPLAEEGETATPPTNGIPQKSNLATAIEGELSGIRWVRNGFSLEQHLLPVNGSHSTWTAGNRGIYRITQYLQSDPEALLTVAVGPKKDPLLQHHIRLLAAEFMAAGLTPDRCLIRPIRKKDLHREDWLKSDYNATHLLWGLSQH